ncbi:MAG: putative protease [Desulforhopalus sp.]|jgi:putative protease
MSDIELLAPVGTIETFHAALDGGADAIYVGAPGFNARNPARELQLEEIGAMTQHCHGLGKKLYIAANSIIFERELGDVVEKLSLLQEIGTDGLIVQDLGLLQLVKRFFPQIPLHGSTLMTVHNSDGVKFLGERGCDRVVVARELTLKEIETVAAKRGNTELEVFIHGAMCFSFSGLCLFSSYLGGKSSLRGKCVQPCRRAYSGGGKGGARGKSKSNDSNKYLFSMNDLSGLEVVPELKRMGISSLKIEGRLRSAHYVQSIVEAYRTVIDADENHAEDALVKAEAMAEQAMSRKTSSGYFFTPQPLEAITPYQSGSMGTHLGRFSTVKKVGAELTCRFVVKSPIGLGDRLRLHVEPGGERFAFRVKSLFILGEKCDKGNSGDKVSISLPDGFAIPAGGRVEVYRVDGASGGLRGKRLPVKRVAEELREKEIQMQQYVDHVKDAVCGDSSEIDAEPIGDTSYGPYASHRKTRKKVGMEWWLKTDSVKMVLGEGGFNPDRYLLPFEKQLLSQVGQIKKGLGRRSRVVTWALPPLIMENDLGRMRKQIKLLIRSGFKSFQLGHASQVLLFRGEKVHLYGDYSLNIYNSQAALELASMGVESTQIGIELDKKSIHELLSGYEKNKSGKKMMFGSYVYGAPALYTSRLAAKHFQYEQQILSPKKEPYLIRKKEGYTQTFPEKPLSILPYLVELKEAGVRYAIVDVCGHSSKRDLEELGDRLMNNGRYSKLPTFNYLGVLE